MDKTIALFIPILALSIPVVAIVLGGLQKIAKTRLEETRMRLEAEGGGSREDLEALRSEVDDVRREMAELQERVDFAERLLARPDARARVGEPDREAPR